MKRWNGWGDVAKSYPFPDSAAAYLGERVGPPQMLPDADLASVVARVPATRLPSARLPRNHLVTSAPEERLRHARGQSLPDWIALRSGQIDCFPDGVAHPADENEVRALLDFAAEADVCLIPYGGGTSVVGHVNPLPGDRPVLTVNLGRLNQLLSLDETSHLATFGAGVTGPELEARLGERGYTLGHFPQSFEYSTLGGWIATRSSGQQSYFYGRIEDLFAGGRLETLGGSWDLPPLPASAAGPDLRHLILGSEGRLGIITQAAVRVRPTPEREGFHAAFFRDWAAGVTAVRAMAQAGLPVSMLRLSDAQETETTLALAGRERLLGWADRALNLLGIGRERCLLLYGLTGEAWRVKRGRKLVGSLVRAHGGLPVGGLIGRQWRKGRFLTPYLRNTLWERGYAIDTLETAVSWSAVPETAADILKALRTGLEDQEERVLAFAHLSHVYTDGASIYVTYLFRRAADPEETLHRWQKLKSAASQEIVAHQGTISHQHGVGTDHAPYLAAEKGEIGLAWLEAVRRAADPKQILNPGKLLPAGFELPRGDD